MTAIPKKKWPIFVLVVPAFYLFSTEWTKEDDLFPSRLPKFSFLFADEKVRRIPLARRALNPSLEDLNLWPFRNVNSLIRVPKQHQSSLKALRDIQSQYVKTLKTLPTHFRANNNKSFNHLAEDLKKAGYACPCKNLVTINEDGRLGNKMSQYMTLLGQSMRLDFLPIISKGMNRALRPLFPYLSVPSEDHMPCACKWTTVPAHTLRHINSKEELFAHGENVFLSEYPAQVEIFEQFYPRVLREFVFDQGIMLKVQTYLNQIKKNFQFRMGFNQSTKITFVGVHNRRTDYASYLKRKVQGRLLSTRYFENAMETFIQAHGNATLFIMVSDDPKWLVKHFSNRQDVFFSFRNWSECHDKVAFDLAVLASANHSIFSFGTFGFWGSYLAGGEAIMAKNISSRPQALLTDAKNNIKRWTFMQDPCLMNGLVPEECSKNASLFGLS